REWVWFQVGSRVELFNVFAEPIDITLNNETDSIPLSVMASGTVSSFIINVEISCIITARAMDAWRLKTHAAIMGAYQQRLREYEEKLAQAQAQQLAQAHGTNPDENRVRERTELRRQAIAILTAQHFEAFGSLQPDKFGVPEMDFDAAEAQGRYARFFEQA